MVCLAVFHSVSKVNKYEVMTWTLNFLFILRWMLKNFDLVVYSLKYYFINVLNGLKHFMTKLKY